jgi:hypothetical protein
MKRHSWGRKLDPRQLAAAEKRRKLAIYLGVYGGSAAAFMMTMAAITTIFH